jgi:hypothetical protein
MGILVSGECRIVFRDQSRREVTKFQYFYFLATKSFHLELAIFSFSKMAASFDSTSKVLHPLTSNEDDENVSSSHHQRKY